VRLALTACEAHDNRLAGELLSGVIKFGSPVCVYGADGPPASLIWKQRSRREALSFAPGSPPLARTPMVSYANRAEQPAPQLGFWAWRLSGMSKGAPLPEHRRPHAVR